MVNNIEQVLAASKKQVAGISEPPLLDCQLMLGHILGKEREWFYIHGDEGLSEAHLLAFQKLLDRRTLGEPLAYLTGTRSFWNRDFQVTPATLIPRPDTELLIETILDQRDNAPCNVLDLGTGSGAIAITLAAERPDWRVTGVDFSAEALNTAITNGRDLSNIEWRQGNWCDGIASQSVDIIVSNPPYIAETDPHLLDLEFEPRTALAAGSDGMDCFRDIVPASYYCLVPGGLLILEHGYDQQEAVMALLSTSGYADIKALKDLTGNPRVVLATKPKAE